MAKPRNPVQMGTIGAPHGVRGAVRVKTFTAEPAALADYGPLHDEHGRIFEVLDIRPANTVAIVRFKGVASREQAEALTGTVLFVERSALPKELDDGEFYHADLIGLTAVDQAGGTLGTVTAIHDFGGGDILELALPGKRSVLIPFTRVAVPDIDIGGGRIRVDPVAAGLVEGGDAAEEAGSDRKRRPPRTKQPGGDP